MQLQVKTALAAEVLESLSVDTPAEVEEEAQSDDGEPAVHLLDRSSSDHSSDSSAASSDGGDDSCDSTGDGCRS